jgi:hypothetical protein
MTDTIERRIRLRRNDRATARSNNEILREGEPAFETDTGDFKIGDGSTTYRKLLGIRSEAEIAEELARGTYRGTNLQEKFADEIASAGSVAAWLHARCAAGNFKGIYPFDYFYDTTVAQTVDGTAVAAGQQRKCVIAAIDPYYNSGNNAMPHHLTIFAGFSAANVVFNTTNNNNGSSYNANPWKASKLYAAMNGVNNSTTNKIGAVGFNGTGGCYLNTFSTALRNIMIEQPFLAPQRYNANSALNDHTSCNWNWEGRGKLFAPSEIEVYGTQIHSKQASLAQCDFEGYGPYCQWDIFKTVAGRLLFGRTSFWLSSVAGGGSTFACIVYGGGLATVHSTSTTNIRAPLCFHIA